jgi:hypothetical protein
MLAHGLLGLLRRSRALAFDLSRQMGAAALEDRNRELSSGIDDEATVAGVMNRNARS